MSTKGADKLAKIIEFHGYTPTARLETENGDIFIAEKWNPQIRGTEFTRRTLEADEPMGIMGGYDVFWAARDNMKFFEMRWSSTKDERIAAATLHALRFIRGLAQRLPRHH